MKPLVPSPACVHGKWLDAARSCLAQGRSMVLVTVVRALGSTPRDSGARMWVDQSGAHATIGGGHLELQAIDTARAMLAEANGPTTQVLHYALGPSLGQCCGGAVWLAFERLTPADLAWCNELHQLLAAGLAARRIRHFSNAQDRQSSLTAPGSGVSVQELDARPTQPSAQWHEKEGVLVDITPGSAPVVVVCGAGHVGKAIVRVLAELPVRVAWLDPREDEWPEHLPDNVSCVDGDAQDVTDFPDGAYWLVLTHSHALDLEIIEQVLRHKPFRYLGLIGSDTKRAKFRSRLLRKFPEQLVDRVSCPIGIVETSSKLPGVIAVSVAAQIAGLLEQSAIGAEQLSA